MSRVIIINTPDATERLGFQLEQCERLGLKHARLAAFTPQTLPDTHDEAYWNRWHRPLPLGERACLWSHRAAWEAVVEEGPLLIVEDDAVLADTVPDLMRYVKNMPDMDHLTLEARGRRKLLGNTAYPIATQVAARRLYHDPSGSAAYFLWPSGAEKLLARADAGAAPVSRLIASVRDLHSYQCEPACAVQLDMVGYYDISASVATISRTKDGGEPSRTTMTQHARRWREQMFRKLRGLRYITSARRERVAVMPEFFEI